MTFLYPQFLWALSALVIPVIIHFFNFRPPKKIFFSNVTLLKNIEQQTKSKNKIKHWLVLLFRMLAIASLVVAFANPVLPSKQMQNSCNDYYVIYIDNSFSMSGISKNGIAIEQAKSEATQIVQALPQNSKIYILTNDLESWQFHPYIKDIALQKISTVTTSAYWQPASRIMSKIYDFREDENLDCLPYVFYLSDFQKNSFDFIKLANDTLLKVALIPVLHIQNSNVFLDSLWFNSPFRIAGRQDSIIVKIVNNSDNSLKNRQISLFVNDTLKTVSNFSIEPNSYTKVTLNFYNSSKGFLPAKVVIDDNPIIYDNTLYFSYYISPKVPVLIIGDKNVRAVEKFYKIAQNFIVTTSSFGNIPYAKFSDYQAVVMVEPQEFSGGLMQAMKNYVEQGGILIIIPPEDLKASFNEFLKNLSLPQFTGKINQKLYVSNLNLNSRILKGAFERIDKNAVYPNFNWHYAINSTFVRKIATFENDDLFLYTKAIGNGFVYVFTAPLNKKISDFWTNPLAVPLFYNMPLFVQNSFIPYYTLKQNSLINLPVKAEENLKLKNLSTGTEFYPLVLHTSGKNTKISLNHTDLIVGNYEILTNDTIGGIVSFNYSRTESKYGFYSNDEIKKILKKHHLKHFKLLSNSSLNLRKQVELMNKGRSFWKIFIIFALLFVLAEVITIKLIKN